MYTVFKGGCMRKIFFGYLFIMVRFLVGGFDIFPDPIGYGLIYLGALELVDRDPNFLRLKNTAMIGAIFTLVVLGFDVFSFSMEPSATTVIVVAILSSAIGLLIIYYSGIHLFEPLGQLPFNEKGVASVERLKRTWMNYFMAMSISTGLVLYMLLSPNSSSFMIVVVAGILSLVFAAQFLVRLNRFTINEARGDYGLQLPAIENDPED